MPNPFAVFAMSDAGYLARAVLRWWLGELRALIPDRVQRAFVGDGKIVAIDFPDDVIAVGELKNVNSSRPANTRPVTLHDIDAEAEHRGPGARPRRSRAIIRLPSRLMLFLSIELPAAAHRNLAAILLNEIERRTPLRRNQIYYDYRIATADRDRRRIVVEVAIVRRETADHALVSAERLGYPTSAFGLIDVPPASARFQFAAARTSRTTGALERNFHFALAGVSCVFVVLSLLIWGWREEAKRTVYSNDLAAAKSELHKVAALESEQKALIELIGFVGRQRTAPLVVKVLAAATQIVPDGTWVYGFEINGSDVHLRGYSSAASALIGIIDKSPLFSDAQFRAPLTQATNSTRERFDLSFSLKAKLGE